MRYRLRPLSLLVKAYWILSCEASRRVLQKELSHNLMVLLQNNVNELYVSWLQKVELQHFNIIALFLKGLLPKTFFRELSLATEAHHKFHFFYFLLGLFPLLVFFHLLEFLNLLLFFLLFFICFNCLHFRWFFHVSWSYNLRHHLGSLALSNYLRILSYQSARL